ncbi:hypothetical protein SAMN05421771_1845 [Granulicella pectinivorans]|uniref:Uncharacterized protein n=1 Tax=Granulicella pectinivorans TaxID=474950 RepID=A0A1I6M510_9BACT|nr:hypothetical protein [Granulicella pectinivorans]SFS10770.1 hypothetical protein SAMN05421771_1845 [Granulicella pectinivorans]
MVFDSAPVSQPEQHGLINRAYETSGLKGIVDLGTQSAKYAVQRPVDLYHQMIETAKAGDWKAATSLATDIITGQAFTADHPIVQAAKAIIMQPVHEVAAAYKADRAAGGSVKGLAKSYNDLKDRVQADAAKGSASGVVGDLAGTLDSHAAGVIPLMGPAIRQIGSNLDEDLHAQNYRAVAGDILGPLLTFGVGKAISSLGEAAEGAVDTAKPSSAKIAGEDVPVASNNPQLPTQSVSSRLASSVATEQGAKGFVNDVVAPAARKAAQSNFVQSALDAVKELRKVRGENPPPATAGIPSSLTSVDDIASLLKKEASHTYSILDDAAEPEVSAWDKKYGDAEKQPTLYGADDKPLPTPDVPPRPKLFTELQDQITDAKSTLKSRVSSQTDKATAKANLPEYQREMDAFLNKHADVVKPGELDAANRTYSQGIRYQWLANRIRPMLQGAGDGSSFGAETASINRTALNKLPAYFDNKFGAGAFAKLLGSDGLKNYNDVLGALATPETGSGLAEWVGKLPFHTGELAKAPVSAIADKLLFNPKAGHTALTLWKQAGKNVQAAPLSPALEEPEE